MLGSKDILVPMIHGLLRISCSRNPKTPQIRSFSTKKGYFSVFAGQNKSCFFHASMKRMTFWPWYHHHKILMSKDALRIVSYFVLPQSYPIFAYREACAPLLCSYRGGSLNHKTTPVQAHRGFRLLTLASSYNVYDKRGFFNDIFW